MMTENDEGVFAKLEEVLESDDEADFIKLLQNHPNQLEVTNSMVNKCVEFGAKNCFIALIRGQVCNRRPTFNSQQLPETGVNPLAYVAHSCFDPEIINIMLTHCAATCLVNIGCTIGVVHGLPIHFALFNLSLMEHLFLWLRGSSLIKLIFLLCLPETKPILDSVRLLAEYTDSINDIAWTILKNGGLKQFVALLLVARDKVMAPFDTGLTVEHYITSEIDSITEGELKLSSQQEEYRCLLMDARGFLALFELAGDDLISYCRSVHNNDSVQDVLSNVADLLLKNRVNVMQFDVTVSGCAKNADTRISPLFMAKISHAYDKKNFYPRPATHSAYDNYYGPTMMKRTSMPLPKLSCLGNQPRQYSTRAAYQARKIIPLPTHFAYFTSKFINRFRFL